VNRVLAPRTRIFVVTLPNGMLVLDSPFDDTLDEYSPDYAVYYLPWSKAYRLHGTGRRSLLARSCSIKCPSPKSSSTRPAGSG